jgi:RNA-binding protein
LKGALPRRTGSHRVIVAAFPAVPMLRTPGFRLQPGVLTGKQRRYLRGPGHDLKPIVQVGKDGIDDGLIAAVEQALDDHELVKIKVGEAAQLDRHDVAEAIAHKTGSEVAQVLGNTVLLYRAHPDDPAIVLP